MLPETSAQNRKNVVEARHAKALLRTKRFKVLPTLQLLNSRHLAQKTIPVIALPPGHWIAVGARHMSRGDADSPLVGKGREHLFQPGITQRHGILRSEEHTSELQSLR